MVLILIICALKVIHYEYILITDAKKREMEKALKHDA